MDDTNVAEAPNPKVLEAQAAAQALEQTQLQKQIEAMELKLAALSDTAATKRREAQVAYQAKYAKKFADVDPAKALSGLPAYHKVTLFDVVYALRVPNGEHQRAANAFALNPEVKADGEKLVDLGPLTPQERVLLAWLTSVAMKGQERNLADQPPPVRLKLLRTLPPVVLSTLANECETLETYLSVVLEIELGNSSPTP